MALAAATYVKGLCSLADSQGADFAAVSAGKPNRPLTDISNQLIQRLPLKDRRRLLDVCEPVELELGAVLSERAQRTEHVHFPTEGFVSLLSVIDDKPGVEVGMVGTEGMLGAQLVLGVTESPLRALVQGQGIALRVEKRAFDREMERSEVLRQSLLRYLYVLMAQLATAAACQRHHMIGPRLARWLLMSQDRAKEETFRVTHEFLAYMLGVRRVGVTGAAGDLQRNGLIAYRRGELTILDRAGLEAAACSCFAADNASYRARFGRRAREHQ